MLDLLESGSFILIVKEQSNNDAHGYVVFDTILMTTIVGFKVIVVVYIHIGVGFGVARSTIRAMPEPQQVGRVTRGLPRFFLCMVLTQQFKTARQGVAGIKRKEP